MVRTIVRKTDFWLPWLILAGGVAYSLYLLFQIPNGVYFSGDGGLKSLVAQQLSQGQMQIDLIKPSGDWISQLWKQGFYPYEEPFVYYINDKYYITFPFTFSVITAPFHALFGYRGLYILPLVAVWAIWLGFYRFCRLFNFNQLMISLGLFGLIFASNLTLYGAMYWEHSLAVALCFFGMLILLYPQQNSGLSVKQAIISGVLIGLSAWVRSEYLAMVATLGGFVFVASLPQYKFFDFISKPLHLDNFTSWGKHKEIFVISMALTVGAFFVCNKVIYGHPLGIHALQIVEGFSLSRRLMEAWESFQELTLKFFEFFPLAIFSLLYLVSYLAQKLSLKVGSKSVLIIACTGVIILLTAITLTQGLAETKIWIKTYLGIIILTFTWLIILLKIKIPLNTHMVIVYLICLVYNIGVCLLVDSGADEIAVGGKQWGPRYLLILLPFVIFILLEQFLILLKSSQPMVKYLSLITLTLLLAVGVHKNLGEGTQFFLKTHQGVAPTLAFLDSQEQPIVVISEQYVAQMLEASLQQEKVFFRANEPKNLVKLSQGLLDNNYTEFTYICYPYEPCYPPQSTTTDLQFTYNQQPWQIQLTSQGEMGKYPVYQAKITKNSSVEQK